MLKRNARALSVAAAGPEIADSLLRRGAMRDGGAAAPVTVRQPA